MDVTHTPCSNEQIRLLNKFYKKHKQNVSCHQQDNVFISTDNATGCIAGAVFIRRLSSSVNLLRSLFVCPEYRRKGLARALCNSLLKRQHGNVYTLCKPELFSFYQSLGFEQTDELIAEKQISTQIKKGLLLLVTPYSD